MADRERTGDFRADSRAATPAIGKALELALVVLYLGVVTTALYARAVPEYRDAAGARVGDRALAAAAGGVENAVPATTAVRVDHRVRVDLPATIRGEGYWIHANNTTRSLVLDHPRYAVGGRVRLALPATVRSLSGRWSSYKPAVVHVAGSSERLRIELIRP